MSEYEVTSLAASMMSNFLASFTIYVTIVTTYVITAFVAGSRLTFFQLSIVNACFTTSAVVIGFLSVTIYQRATSLAARTWGLAGTVAPPFDFTWVILLLYLCLLLGSYLFMSSVRKDRTE